MTEPPYDLTAQHRPIVLATILEVCRHRKWLLIAAHVRTAHVHVVADVEHAPERAIGDLKAYASRRLAEAGIDGARTKRWSRFGSTVRLGDREAIQNAVRYVIDRQGEPMECYLSPDW